MLWAFGVCCVGLGNPCRDQFSFSILLLAVFSEGASATDLADRRPQWLHRKTDSHGGPLGFLGAYVPNHPTPHLARKPAAETQQMGCQ